MAYVFITMRLCVGGTGCVKLKDYPNDCILIHIRRETIDIGDTKKVENGFFHWIQIRDNDFCQSSSGL